MHESLYLSFLLTARSLCALQLCVDAAGVGAIDAIVSHALIRLRGPVMA